MIWADSVEENQLKMALAYNFARYTQWPELPPHSFQFCIMADKPVLNTFNQLNGRQVDNHTITVRNVKPEDSIENCQVLYLSGRDRGRIGMLLENAASKPILTIGELPEFIDKGGVIRLFRQGEKFRFAINPAAAQRNQLQISSRVLQLAIIEGE